MKRLLGTKTNEDSCSPLSRWYSNFSRAKLSCLIYVQHFLSPAMQVGFIWIVTPDIFAKYWFEAPRYAKTLVLKIREFLRISWLVIKRLDPKIFRYTKNSWNLRFLRYWPKSLHPLQRINMFVLLEIVISKAQKCISSLDYFTFSTITRDCNKDCNYMRMKCAQWPVAHCTWN